MRSENRTVVGIFSDITAARRATDELHSKGISAARLVENDQALTFTGTAEGEHHRGGGIKGFFARLFGFDDDRPAWQLSSDSETWFQDAYDKKHHLVVIEDCTDISLSREIISRMGGVVEEKGSHYYHTERGSQRSQATAADASARAGSPDFSTDSSRGINSERQPARDESLDSGRRAAVDPAASSALGVDVDHMPFGHSASHRDTAGGNRMSVSDRISQSGLSGTADHVPFSGQVSGVDSSQGGDRVSSAGRSSTAGTSANADDMPFAGQSSDVSLGQTISSDPSFGTGVSVPSEHTSFAGQALGDSLIVSADRLASVDRSSDTDSGSRKDTSMESGQSSSTSAGSASGVPSDSNSMPFAGRSLNTGVTVHGGPGGTSVAGRDRALDGISGDADRTPLVGQRSQDGKSINPGPGASAHRSFDATIVGDDRIHDRGVSNADVSRLSSDRIMELDEEDQPIVDKTGGGIDRVGRLADSEDESIDNGHILPDRSFPPPRPQSPTQPGV
ncbi:hypothetical protein [Oligoflexus tunisiensis]|uniref:hypothetical protein n=1 Tax=Oligoflexus tunisiensis TaxID=708132 RepID=UPI00114D27A3|nr:hypothetical protein [Oligoflexus tunisiensis]